MSCSLQQPFMPMKRKKQEDLEEGDGDGKGNGEVSTELSHWLDYEANKEKKVTFLITANDTVSSSSTNNNAAAAAATVAASSSSSSSSSPSTELELYSDPWKIKKRLKESDLGNLSRLLIPTNSVQEHVLPFMSNDAAQQIDSGGCRGGGLRVSVLDHDTETVHQLVFKRWLDSSKSYVFTLNWIKDFVKRRDLKIKDEIGLFWDCLHSRFVFCVLNRT
ncbi:hypothetical protein Ddye_013783 [Dipteronia dyeriana]|uniref:B3 domain-containing protein n=1 Tax=Dipteronia dyeriana TaxID=168575 RepID=A0AAD9X731_9ROSI|nr:hypothetical protein Ddye_013783 [Dipteronia dyeriana]